MSNSVLKVRNLGVWLDTVNGRRKVVDNVSFNIDKGKATGLVGESGCGKSMTALAIMGLLPSSSSHVESGGIEINGQDISTMNRAAKRRILGRDIAMVFQQPGTALDPVFTIGQQIKAVYQRHIRSTKAVVRQAMLDSLQQVGFDKPSEIAAAYPHQLSGGMQQLTMIAMATVCKPAVLIADEPTTSLDNSTQALILQQLGLLQSKQGMAILLISHDLGIVRHGCQNAMVMYAGRMVEASSCESLFTQPQHPYSAGLLSCIPHIGKTQPTMINAIPGQAPTAGNLPWGCQFEPRCRYAIADCRQSEPVLASADNRSVACFRPLS